MNSTHPNPDRLYPVIAQPNRSEKKIRDSPKAAIDGAASRQQMGALHMVLLPLFQNFND
jgi:hypothetical protein